MSIYTLLILALCAFVVLHLYAVPRLEASWAQNPSATKITQAGVLAGFRAARTLAQLALITFGGIVVALWLASLFFDTSSANTYLATIRAAEEIKGYVSAFGSGVLGSLEFWGAIAGLTWLAYQRQRRDLTAEVQAAVEQEYPRLFEALNRGQLEELPPTPRMRQLEEQMRHLERAIPEVGAGRLESRLSEGELWDLLRKLRKLWLHEDLVRRVKLQPRTPPRERVWPRIIQAFTSKGFASDTSRLAKASSYAGTILLLTALVGVSAPAVTATISDKLESLWDLQVKKSHEEAQASWAAARASARTAANQQNIPEVDATTLARSFLRAYAQSEMWRVPEVRAEQAAVTTARIKQQILERHSGGAAAGAATAGPPPGPAASSSRVEEALVQRVRTDLRADEQSLWRRINEKLSAHAKTYRTPTPASDFAYTLVDEILGISVKEVAPEFSDVYGKQLSSVLTKGVKASIKRAMETKFTQFMTDLAGDTLPDEALRRVALATEKELTPNEHLELAALKKVIAGHSRQVASELRATPPRLRSSVHVPQGEEFKKIAVEHVRLEMERGGRGTRREGLRSLAQFDDYFASSKKDFSATPRNQVLAEAGRPSGDDQARVVVERARDYERQSRSDVVGGVVIGKPPSDAGEADIVDFAWSTGRSSKFSFSVTHRDGAKTKFGPVDADVVYRSLLYSADGRPTSVTILNSDIAAQRVLVHPALEDSRLGCEMIELDRFIFSYIDVGARSATRRAMARALAQYDLYTIAVANGWVAVGLLTSERERSLPDLKTSEADLLAEIADSSLFTDVKKSTFAARYSIYSPAVLDLIRPCTGQGSTSLSTYRSCIQDKARYKSKADAKRWKVAGELTLVSGVRERDFAVDSGLSFVKGPSTRDESWPLDFLVQDTSMGEDNTPWSFPDVTPDLPQAVIRLMNQDLDARSIVVGVRDFAIMQRFFRVALAGRLGSEFPLASLPVLTEEARAVAKDGMQTARWIPPSDAFGAAARNTFRRVEKGLAPNRRANLHKDLEQLGACISALERLEATGVLAEGLAKVCAPADVRRATEACKVDAKSCDVLDLAEEVATAARRMTLASQLGAPLKPVRERSRPAKCGPPRAS